MCIEKIKFPFAIGLVTAALFTFNASASLIFTEADTLSESNSANKTKLVRMGNGWLVSSYGDATAGSQLVYDLKADAIRLSRDNFVKVCHPANNESQCSLASDWGAPVNISNSAHLSSIATKWNINSDYPSEFYGDAEKSNIFVSGNFAVVTQVSKYCPGGKQRLVSYNERDGLSVPFSCIYASYTNNVAGVTDSETGEQISPPVWNTIQMTDGSRDAKSDFNKGLKYDTKGLWAISWQEDPHGLQIGGADGPGEGASGASVTHGTDVWYSYTENLMGTPFSEPVRISDNYTNDGSGGNTSPVFHPDDFDNEIESLERGTTGAARPNLMLTGVVGTPPTAVIAYEESKGSNRLDSGKYIRYHEFIFNQPPASQGFYQNGEPGCIISDPAENSRRVRFVSQHTPSVNGLRMGVFWKQGFPTQGGPSDIMVRVSKVTTEEGSTGLRPADMFPAVDPGCRVTPYEDAQLLANTPASNISTNTIPWTPVGEGSLLPPANVLTDTTSLNPYEDARAHRAAIVGDDFYIGYSYAKDWAVATVVDLDNYNFWLRRYSAVDDSWTIAKNLSNITDVKIHVKEPRLVKTPGSGMGCTDGSYLENCSSKSTLIVAWGTESNVYQHIGDSVEGDISYTRTKDKGITFEEPVVVSGIGDGVSRFESQLRPSPAGNIIWTAWNESDLLGKHAMLSVTDESEGIPPTPPAGGGTPPPPPPADSYNLSIESLEMDTTDPVVDEDGIYYVIAKQKNVPARVTVKNTGGLTVSGEVYIQTITGGGFSYGPYPFTLGTEETFTQEFSWNSRNKKSYTWRAVVTTTEDDSDIDDNILEVITTIVRR